MAAPLCSPLVLVGFMGSGKTTVGRLLAARLGWHFCDLDDRIEAAAGAPITTIFAQSGEAAFRRIEHEVLELALTEMAKPRRVVLALGGGTVVQPENQQLLRQAGAVSVFLQIPIEVLLLRCARMTHRPLFRDEASFRALYEYRLPFYRQAQHTVVAGDEPPERMVERVLQLFTP